MKCTNRNARQDRSGKHNDRNFNLDNASHIDQSKVRENRYYTYNDDTDHTLAEIELEFYERHFGDRIREQNERNILARHKDRNRTIEQLYHGKNTRPEDKLLQIGNIKEHATPDELWECALAYKDRFNELYGDKCKILDMALHLDEATPHVHVRRVWIAEDDDGREIISQGKALEQLGVLPPDPSAPIGKKNNAKMTFTKTDQYLFRDICIEKGLDIDKEPPQNREHLSTLEYKKQEISKDVEELERRYEYLSSQVKDVEETVKANEEMLKAADSMIDYFENDPFFAGIYSEDIEEARKKDKAEQMRIYADIYAEEVRQRIEREGEDSITYAAARTETAKENRSLKKFIGSKGMTDEYEQYIREEQYRQQQQYEQNFF